MNSVISSISISVAAWFGGYGLMLGLNRGFWQPYSYQRTAFFIAFGVLSAAVILACIGCLRQQVSQRNLAMQAALSICVSLVLFQSGLEANLIGPWHGFALLWGAVAAGTLLGKQLMDPAHIWPLLVVAMGFDGWSVLSSHPDRSRSGSHGAGVESTRSCFSDPGHWTRTGTRGRRSRI